MKFSESDYVGLSPFDGDMDVDIRCQKVKLVKVRKRHVCHLSLIDGCEHYIEYGEFSRYESAIVEGAWGSCYCCIPCLDKWLEEDCGLTPNGEFYCCICEKNRPDSVKTEFDGDPCCMKCRDEIEIEDAIAHLERKAEVLR